jgi:hypothetical protein
MLRFNCEELEISGSREELVVLAREMARGDAIRDPIRLRTSEPRDVWLQITPSTGPVRVTTAEGGLQISGAADKLNVLADNLLFLSKQVVVYEKLKPHLHLEYVPGHQFLDEESEPIIVTLDDEIAQKAGGYD